MKQSKAQFKENGEIDVYHCNNCGRISFKKKCWTCIDNNKKYKMEIITLIKKQR